MFDLFMVCVEVGFGLDVVMMWVLDEFVLCCFVMVEEMEFMLLELCLGFFKEKVFINLVLCIGVEDVDWFVLMLI